MFACFVFFLASPPFSLSSFPFLLHYPTFRHLHSYLVSSRCHHHQHLSSNASRVITPTSSSQLHSPWHSGVEEAEVILASAGLTSKTSKTQCQCGLHHHGLSRKHTFPPPNPYRHQKLRLRNLRLAMTIPTLTIPNATVHAITAVVIVTAHTLIPVVKPCPSVLVVLMRMVKL